MPICPSGHDSGSGDYCDVCGLAISSGPASAAAPANSAPVRHAIPQDRTPLLRLGLAGGSRDHDFFGEMLSARLRNKPL